MHERMVRSMHDRLWQARRRYESLDLHLRQLSPLAVLNRGYAIVQNPQGAGAAVSVGNWTRGKISPSASAVAG